VLRRTKTVHGTPGLRFRHGITRVTATRRPIIPLPYATDFGARLDIVAEFHHAFIHQEPIP